MTAYVRDEMKRFNYLIAETDAAYHDAAQKLGLSDSCMQILYAICDAGKSCLLGDIIHMSGLSKQTVNSALRKLEKEQIVYLELCGKRKKKVFLTEYGKALAKNTVFRVIEIENEIFDSWAEEERKAYLGLTQKYLIAFREKIKEL